MRFQEVLNENLLIDTDSASGTIPDDIERQEMRERLVFRYLKGAFDRRTKVGNK